MCARVTRTPDELSIVVRGPGGARRRHGGPRLAGASASPARSSSPRPGCCPRSRRRWRRPDLDLRAVDPRHRLRARARRDARPGGRRADGGRPPILRAQAVKRAAGPDRRRPARRPRGAAPAAEGRGPRESRRPPRPAGVLAALEARDFDAVLIDLNYTRDTTSGPEGLDLLAPHPRARPQPPGRRDDRLGHASTSPSRRCGAARATSSQKPWDNARLLTTLRTQIALGRALQAGRPPRGREPHPARTTATARDGRRVAGDAPGARRSSQRVGPSDANVLDHRRERHAARASSRARSTRPRRARASPS